MTPQSVKVSSRYQISLPAATRKQLNIQAGDRLLVDVQDGLLILVPQPDNYTRHLAGLHQEIWQNVNPDAYVARERSEW